MVDDLEGRPIGERIQILRQRKGKSRAVVAGMVGRSESWLKDIEKGRRLPPRLDMLIKLAEAIGVRDLVELTGQTQMGFSLERRHGHPVVAEIQDAIESAHLRISLDEPTAPAALAANVSRAWSLWHTSPTPRADAGALLPQLIRDGRRAVRVLDGTERRQTYMALSSAYALAEQVLAWVSTPALLWLAADRCMDAAQQADDPETLATAAWVLGNVWRATGREEDAWLLMQDAAELLEPQLVDGPDSVRATWGACQLHGSITAARLGREGDAMRSLDNADRMADQLPNGYAHPEVLFGRPNTDLTGVSVWVDLHRSGSALDHSHRVDPDGIPSIDRRARLWLEMARAYSQRKDHTSTLHVLQKAATVSEESMRCHPIARELAGELVTVGGRLIEREARSLAHRLGMTA